MKYIQARLLVHNFDACFEFYSQTLGLKVIWGAPGDVYASFECKNLSSLAIYQAKLMAESLENLNIDRRTHSDRFLIIVGVDDVDGFYKKLQKLGHKFLNEPHDEPAWGNRVVHLRDPEGNLVELNQIMPLADWDEDLLAAKDKYDFEL